MKVIGLIAEYNPFHNGHLYQINKIKKMYPDSIIISVVSTSFSSRGNISLLNKWEKTRVMLENKIDIVLELPYFFTIQSSNIFAHAALQILNEFKIDILVFGSESNSINELLKYEYDKDLKINKIQDKTINYPKALSKTYSLPNTPNDILAYSYIKEIKINNYKIEPIAIKRTNDYHDLLSNKKIISASNIRQKFFNGEFIKKYIPKSVYNILEGKSINNSLYFDLIRSKIITDNNLGDYLDVNDELKNRMIKSIFHPDMINEVKSKRYTYNKISRMINHILIGLSDVDAFNIKDIEYIRVLGINSVGKNYLNNIKKNIKYPIIYNYNKNFITSAYEFKSVKIYALITRENELVDMEYKKNIIKNF